MLRKENILCPWCQKCQICEVSPLGSMLSCLSIMALSVFQPFKGWAVFLYCILLAPVLLVASILNLGWFYRCRNCGKEMHSLQRVKGFDGFKN